MKLNPEDLEIVSFPTDAETSSLYAPITVETVDPGHPTPQTHCFVCD